MFAVSVLQLFPGRFMHLLKSQLVKSLLWIDMQFLSYFIVSLVEWIHYFTQKVYNSMSEILRHILLFFRSSISHNDDIIVV